MKSKKKKARISADVQKQRGAGKVKSPAIAIAPTKSSKKK